MSLDWNIEKVANWELKKKKYRNHLETLIWMTMSLGIRKITEDNYRLFHKRYKQYREATYSEFEKEIYKELKLTDIKRWIGLYTNADTLSDKQFQKKLERMKLKRA